MDNTEFYFTLSYPHKVELGDPIFDCKNLLNLHVLRCSESSIIFLAVGLRVCVWHHYNSKTNINKKYKFGILKLYNMHVLLESFHENRTNNLCTGVHEKIRICYGLWMKFLVSAVKYV